MSEPQLPLDFSKRARRADPQTSHDAAASAGEFAHGHYALILGSLGLHGEQTIYQLAEHTGLSHVQVARRLPEMADAVPAMAKRTNRTRPSPSGRDCTVWERA
jgi:hypothetical protein